MSPRRGDQESYRNGGNVSARGKRSAFADQPATFASDILPKTSPMEVNTRPPGIVVSEQ